MLYATIKLKSWKHQKWFTFLKFCGSLLLIKSWSNIACQWYWSSEKFVWMSSFLNIRRSRPEECCKKCVLKINILQNSLKNIHDAVFKLIKFQAKGLQLYWKESPAYLLSYEFRRRFKGVRDPPPPPVKRPARGFPGWVRVRLGIGLSLESGGFFRGDFSLEPF